MDVSDGRRVIGMLPMDPKQIDVVFHIYTHESQNESFQLGYKFDTESLLNSTFNHTHQTVIIAHGFKSGMSQWMIVRVHKAW